jgi:hypothetical protein
VSLLTAAFAPITAAEAQDALRSTFPGRRVGGGTRGDCSARVVAHLVPESNVFGAAGPTTLGVLEGPANEPRPLVVAFQPRQQEGGAAPSGAGPKGRTLPPAPAGVTLLQIPAVAVDTVWETSYQCDDGDGKASDDPLAFVSNVAPPAQTLLVSAARPGEPAMEAEMRKLRASCGASVPSSEVASVFRLGDVITRDWPDRLPVRCL